MAEKVKICILINANRNDYDEYYKQILQKSREAIDKITMNLGDLSDCFNVIGYIFYRNNITDKEPINRSDYNYVIDVFVDEHNLYRLKLNIIKSFCYYIYYKYEYPNIDVMKACYEMFTKLGYKIPDYNQKRYLNSLYGMPIFKDTAQTADKILKDLGKELSKSVDTGMNSILEPKLDLYTKRDIDLREQCHNYLEEDVKMPKIKYGQSVLYNKMAKPETFVVSFFDIDRVIFNNPATIVFWKDGTKTVVKVNGGDVFNPEVGLMACFTKKALGNKYEYYGKFNKIINKYNKGINKKAKQASKRTTRKTVKK